MNFHLLEEINVENLILKKVSDLHKQFIVDLFKDAGISKYYIVPEEAHQDYKRLVEYWLHDIANRTGYGWIIYKKGVGLFSRDKPCGFFTFQFKDSINNARITYALAPDFRKQGIITKTAQHVFKKLIEFGVETVEADIDRDNSRSEKVVERLGFKANKSCVLCDPEMMRDGDMRMRFLWKKEIYRNPILASVIPSGRFGINAPHNDLIVAINKLVNYHNTYGPQPEVINQYFYFLGRVRFSEGRLNEAQQAFGQHNMTRRDMGKDFNYETFFWFSRISVAQGDLEMGRSHYETSFENFDIDEFHITLEEMKKFNPTV